MFTGKVLESRGAFMKPSRFSAAFYAVALIIALGNAFPETAYADRKDKKQDLVFFGDSLSDTGNRYFDEGSMNTPPYALAAEQNLIPSLPYAIGGPTYTNGQPWVEYVARAIGRGGAAQAALRSNGIAANYAYAGARASNALPLPPNTNRNLGDQVVQYIADAGPGGISADTLHVILIGGNDIGDAIFLASLGGDPTVVLQNAIASVFNNALALAQAGARRFLFLTTPNAGYIPAFGGNPLAIGLGNQLAFGFNCAVVGITPTFDCPFLPPAIPATVAATLTGLFNAEVAVFDSKALLDDMVDNPGNYGLSNTSDHCIKPFEPPFRCDKPDEYLYWDNIHPTARVHEIIGKAVVDLLSK
jgi:phospholipase/lecithinase/hemolysin